jgi:cytoplasmic iron level regulating protein YaaA (DUF328/UPF0246 family)
VLGAGSTIDAVRHAVFSEVRDLCARDPAASAVALKLPAGAIDDACKQNANVFECPTMPALDRYTGVVYQGLDAATLSRAERRAANASVLIFSGGVGIVRGSDLVPWYRIPASARLPVAGPVAALWRPALAALLPSVVGDQLVIDLRSSDYTALWRPPAAGGRVVTLRVLQQRKVGRRYVEQVVSYHSKISKGRIARALIAAAALRRPAKSFDDIGTIVAAMGFEVRAAKSGLDAVETLGRSARKTETIRT